MILSCRPAPCLRHLIRYYFQVEASLAGQVTVQPVPARSPPILEFMFGSFYEVQRLSRKLRERAAPVALVGARTHHNANLHLQGRIDAFTIVFQPGGLTTLFGLPASELTDADFNAEDVMGRPITELYERLGEAFPFAARARVADEYLQRLLPAAGIPSGIVRMATAMNLGNGCIRVAELANRAGLGIRQFERRFQREVGIAPKLYSRILRFEAALRLKSLSPARPWTDIAHALGYHDQMHMVHDFRSLSGDTPGAISHRLDMFVMPEARCSQHSRAW